MARSVGPPWSQCRRWWASHQAGDRSQPATAQPPSRTTRAARWAGVTTRLVRPTSSGWVGAHQGPGGAGSPPPAAGPPGWPRRRGAWLGLVRWRVTSTRVTAPSQASRRHASGSSGQARRPTGQAGGGQVGCPGRPSPAAGAVPHRPGAAGRPPGCGGPTRPGHRPAAAHRSGCRGRCWGGPGLQGRQQGLAGLGVQQAVDGHHALQVGDSHSPRCWWRCSAWVSAPSGSATRRRWAMTRRSRGGSNRRAASSRTGSASAARWSGRSWVPRASTWAWAGESSPSARAWAVPVSGPGTGRGRVRTKPGRCRRPGAAGCVATRRWSRPGRPGRPGGAAGVHRGQRRASGRPGGPSAPGAPAPPRPGRRR